MRGAPILLAVTLAAGLVAAPPAAAEPRPFNAHDLVTMARLSEPRVSPDGEWIAFTLRETDLEADRGRTDLWRVRSGGGDLRRLTTHEAADGSPRWSPDGASLYFLSSRSGSSQVWRLPTAGGEAVQVTDLPLDVGAFLVSPDGSKLALALEVFPGCDTLRCTVDRLAAEEDSKADGRLYDGLFVRHWDAWKDGRRSRLFVLPADGGGEPVDVTRGLDADVPSKPFGGAEELAFTPDGKGLVFTARAAGREEAWSTDFDLYLAPADGSAAPRKITVANRAWDTRPVFSPDGKTLAYLAMARPGFEADRFRIVLLPWGEGGPAGEPRVLTEAWDRSPGSLAWAPDGRTLYATADHLGNVALFAVDAGSGEARELVSQGHVRDPGVAPGPDGHRIVFGRDTLTSPVDLWSVAPDGSDPRRLTEVNAPRLAEVRMGEYEQLTFAGWNDETVYGYLVKPAGFAPEKRYPVAFLIHGGPQGSFGNDFHYRWNPQVYAGAGYAAVMIDFHGSTGYGQGFTDSISGDWGGKPLVDLQKGLAAVLEHYPFLDGDRVCALGASYGGYMVNWIAGRWPEPFRCLVNHDGVFDLRSMYFATEELWFPEWEFGGPYWENPELYEAHNPVRHVESWRTPMLVIHGALDYRVPETQGLGAFTALQRRGVPSRFL
ncbi:MAG TPA: S9 family peptidase, partial [Thermoanaerobaculia bacterium]|nr:S9 family peptidase [Thermoanaerobaculia bacterium]